MKRLLKKLRDDMNSISLVGVSNYSQSLIIVYIRGKLFG